MQSPFVPGLELAYRFYREAVAPLLDRHVPGLDYAAALIGSGSEVLGFDTERSTDHDWGPRLQLFLSRDDAERLGTSITELLSEQLPRTFLGYSTHWAAFESGTNWTIAPTEGPLRHGVVVADLDAWLTSRLGFNPSAGATVADWLAAPTQLLAEVIGGAVFHDGPGRLTAVRRALQWYPDDVWRYVLACQWRRIAQEEAFPGRCAQVGDDLGSTVVTARLVRDLMRLMVLMERRYPPYSKWLGSAFARIPAASALTPELQGAMAAATWPERERHLVAAYETVAARHNDLELTPVLDPRTRPYFDRPFQVIGGDRFTDALRESITDPDVGALPVLGAIDQFIDSTDVLIDPKRHRVVAKGMPLRRT
jgi:hypothetical protein